MIARHARRGRLPPSLLAAPLLLGAVACARPSVEAQRSAATTPTTSEAMRVFRDPKTGAFVEPPPGTTMAAPAPAATAPTALTEEAAPGGGRMIRLRGAVHSHVVAHADGGRTTVSCGTAPVSP
jgi:hypothetical protein